MKSIFINTVIITAIIFSVRCGNTVVSPENIPSPEALEEAFARSIRVPVDSVDTVLIRYHELTFCGNSGEDEIEQMKRDYFTVNLVNENCLAILNAQSKIKFFGFRRDSAIMPSIGSHEHDSLNPFAEENYFQKNRIELYLDGKQISNDSVLTLERYTKMDMNAIEISKLFVYNGEKWEQRSFSGK